MFLSFAFVLGSCALFNFFKRIIDEILSVNDEMFKALEKNIDKYTERIEGILKGENALENLNIELDRALECEDTPENKAYIYLLSITILFMVCCESWDKVLRDMVNHVFKFLEGEVNGWI